MKFVAIIPARGGSKRLPKKNIKLFDGLPLISYSINLALNSDLISRVIVSTDNLEIAEIGRKYGAEICLRPTELSTDTSTTSSVLKHVVDNYIEKDDNFPDGIITLQVTNPLRNLNFLNNCINKFVDNYQYIDSLITVSENKHKLGEVLNNRFVPSLYSLEQRSQDIKKYYFENGQIYITKTNQIIHNESIFGNNVLPFICKDIFSTVDIDTLEEFELAELIYQKFKDKI